MSMTFFAGFIVGWGVCTLFFTLVAVLRPEWLCGGAGGGHKEPPPTHQ